MSGRALVFACLLLLSIRSSGGFRSHTWRRPKASAAPRRCSLRMEFGDVFYKGFETWCNGFTDEDRKQYPEYFVLPEGVYEVALPRPLGIVFEEVEAGQASGIRVVELVEGGNAAESGKIGEGDVLLACTGIKMIGAKFERPLVQVDILDWDTIMSAIASNEERFRCPGDEVIMQFVKAGYEKPQEYLYGNMRSTASPLEPLFIG